MVKEQSEQSGTVTEIVFRKIVTYIAHLVPSFFKLSSALSTGHIAPSAAAILDAGLIDTTYSKQRMVHKD